jgi:3-oxoacyl-[acyl-carrier-protein] synthase-3
MKKNLKTQISSVSGYVPGTILTNGELSQKMDTSDDWIRERTGIRERRIADSKTSTSDLGTRACEIALKKAGWTIDDVDLILAATLSPDYYFPGIGVQIQAKLGAKTIPAMDIRAQCSGFAWGLMTGDSFIRSGSFKRVLVVGAEIHSRILEFSNRGRDTAVLFGDGAGAACLEACEGPRGILDFHMGSDGSGADLLCVKRPGLSAGTGAFLSEEDVTHKTWLPHMEGRQVFRHAVTRMTESCQMLLDRNQLTSKDIHLLLPHQANLRINQAVAEKLALREDQVFNNIGFYGNTTAATIPLLMADAEDRGLLKKGDLVLVAAFGAGFTWGSLLIRW